MSYGVIIFIDFHAYAFFPAHKLCPGWVLKMFTYVQDFRTHFSPLRAEMWQFQQCRVSAQHLHRPTAQHMSKYFSQSQTEYSFVSITYSLYTQETKCVQETPRAQATPA